MVGSGEGACSGRVCLAGSSCGQGLGAESVETEWLNARIAGGEVGRAGKTRLGAGLERVLDIRMNNLGSILEENISVQS